MKKLNSVNATQDYSKMEQIAHFVITVVYPALKALTFVILAMLETN